MKRLFALGFMMVVCALSVYGAESSLKATLIAPTRVGTSILPEGDCKITWVVNGATAQVTFRMTGQKPMTFPAQVVEEKSDTDALEINTVKGTKVLQSIALRNMKLVLSPTEGAGN